MRLRQLDLIRYGGFADRSVNFGDGKTDLHLVIGPNEAGKSTMLEAIGDLLFGIRGQTGQGWRFDYSDLRIRALVEHDGGLLDVTRRKGNRNTLLGPDGAALPDDMLARLFPGVDRKTFERMFGLDHAKLREGGQAILEGRDDAARIVLEAGTGLTGIGDELKRLDEEAGGLFKPNASVPAVNRLMRERADALAAVRSSSLSDAAWSEIKSKRQDAERRRGELVEEATAMASRAAALERIGRTRGPLARLAAARDELAALGDVPELPLDAGDRLAAALSSRNAATAVADQHRSKLDSLRAEVAAIVLPAALLDRRADVEDLAEQRVIVLRSASELAALKAELAAVERRLAGGRLEAGLADHAPLPSAGWRRRAREHLEARRATAAAAARDAATQAGLARSRAQLSTELQDCPPPVGLDDLRAALTALPEDAAHRLGDAEASASRAERRATMALSALDPWRGSAAELQSLSTPSPELAAEHSARIEVARAEWLKAKQDAGTAATDAARARARLERLAASGDLPTPEAVRDARTLRDTALADVRRRLACPRQEDDGDAGEALAAAVVEADRLVDRRGSETERLAAHALATSALAEAEAVGQVAVERVAEWEASVTAAESAWSTLLDGLGFERVVPPPGMAAWRRDREAALTAVDEAAQAAVVRDRLADAINRARSKLCAAMAAAGTDLPQDIDTFQLRDLVEAAAERLDAAALRRQGLLARIEEVDRNTANLSAAAEQHEAAQALLEAERAKILEQGALSPDADDDALADALEALEGLATDAAAIDDLAPRVATIESEAASFDTATAALASVLGRPVSGSSTDLVAALTRDLAGALADEAKLNRISAEQDAAAEALEGATRQADAAEAVIKHLMQQAGVTREDELAPVIAAAVRAAQLRTASQDLAAELASLGDGRGIDELAAEAAALSHDEAAAELAAILERRSEIETAREEVGRLIAEAEAAAAGAATATAAADAQQAAQEAAAAMAEAAERHVQAVASAALLRWVIDRHRATAQAPLISRAGALFTQVTGGHFAGLVLDYDDNDRPRIVGVRGGGSRVGVEGMSEGTRDQLYLALRLGSIEGRAGGTPLPLVCDDLLVTADDQRAGLMLNVLAAASSWTQVILFSHHEHIIDVARRSVGDDAFRLHRIEPMVGELAA